MHVYNGGEWGIERFRLYRSVQTRGHKRNRRLSQPSPISTTSITATITSQHALAIKTRSKRQHEQSVQASAQEREESVENEPDPEATEVMAVPTETQQDIKAVIASVPHHFDGTVQILEQRPSEQLTATIFALAHDDVLAGHFGGARTLQLVQQVVRWPDMDGDIRRLARECPTCQRLRARLPPPLEFLSTRAACPFESVMMDFVGPFREEKKVARTCS